MICSSVNLLFLMSAILLNGGPLATSHWYGLGGAGHGQQLARWLLIFVKVIIVPLDVDLPPITWRVK